MKTQTTGPAREDAYAYYSLGNAFTAYGKIEKAIVAYRKAVAIDAKYSNAYYNLGAALALQGKTEDATAIFEKVIAIDPKAADAYNSLGLARI